MDSYDATKVLYFRIRKLEPEYLIKKIIGYILIQNLSDQEMIRLAFGPDTLIQNLIQKAKLELGLILETSGSPPISPSVNPVPVSDIPLNFSPFQLLSPRPFSSFQVPTPCWDPQVAVEPQLMQNSDFIPLAYSDSMLQDQLESANPELSGFPSDNYYAEATLSNLSTRGSRHYLSEFPPKVCHYFNKGFCKHGSNCRYFHGRSFSDSYPNMFGPNSTEVSNEDQIFSPGSLEKLECEITELLKSRRGNPISIAALPMMYYEKYGRTLQAEGYLTESQRHGKAGYSLTRLLARLKNSVRLIDRPHGQHSVILVEDASKYMESRSGERNDPGPIVSGSRQIYLTFPAESTFSEDDVANYFNTFGRVQDVRIPCQQKRMFGFVTFDSADTVKIILSKGNPHYVCGARVLVKPYREKSKFFDRKYSEKFDPPMYYLSHDIDMDSELRAKWEYSRLVRKRSMEEHEHTLELQTRRLSELQLARKSLVDRSYFGYSVDELKISEDHSKFPSAARFNYLLDVLNSGSTSDDNPKHTGINYTDQESGGQGLNLPDSPFASPMANSISTVT